MVPVGNVVTNAEKVSGTDIKHTTLRKCLIGVPNTRLALGRILWPFRALLPGSVGYLYLEISPISHYHAPYRAYYSKRSLIVPNTHAYKTKQNKMCTRYRKTIVKSYYATNITTYNPIFDARTTASVQASQHVLDKISSTNL